MLDLLKSLQNIIERKVTNTQTLRSTITPGERIIPVRSAKRFERCDNIAIYNQGDGEAEFHEIDHILDYRTIQLVLPVSDTYTTENGRVQSLVEGEQFVRNIYIGDPPVIPRYPAITIAARSRSQEPMTLGSIDETFDVEISTYIMAAQYEQGYEYVLNLTKKIERTLNYTLYPLVNPYSTTVLTQDVTDTDTVIRVEEDGLNRQFAWFFIENDKYTRHVSPSCYLENGVIELKFPVGVNFSAGDTVIFPGRHYYDTRPQSTEYGNLVKNTLLFGTRISYYAKELVLRPDPFYYPLTS